MIAIVENLGAGATFKVSGGKLKGGRFSWDHLQEVHNV